MLFHQLARPEFGGGLHLVMVAHGSSHAGLILDEADAGVSVRVVLDGLNGSEPARLAMPSSPS